MSLRELLEFLILGFTQGLTEFLPVSSSGHLVLLQDIFNITEGGVFFSVMLHFATLLAVVIYFYKDIINLFKPPYKTLLYLIIATIPAGIMFIFIKDHIDAIFGGSYLCFAFLITAVLLFITEIIQKQSKEAQDIDAKKSLIMGIAQSIAIIPGISRSGSTICAGLIAGGEREKTAKFSFLMSIPIIFASAVYELAFETHNISVNVLPLLIGMVAAFLSALFAIKVMLNVIKKANYKWFSVYLAAISIIVFINNFVSKIW